MVVIGVFARLQILVFSHKTDFLLQVVLPSEKRPPALGFHASVSASGVLQSSHKGQDVELVADEVQVCKEYRSVVKIILVLLPFTCICFPLMKLF